MQDAGSRSGSLTSSSSSLPTVAVGRIDPLLDVECDFCNEPAVWLMIRERTEDGMARPCGHCAMLGLTQLLPEVPFEDEA
jgi:hypothetical protein